MISSTVVKHLKKGKTLLILAVLFAQCSSLETTASRPQEADASRAGMAEVPAGLFIYGTSEEAFKKLISTRLLNFPGMEDRLRKVFEIPEKTLALPGFYIDRFEVTNEEFREFVIATGYRPEDDSDYLKHWNSATEFPAWAATFPVVWVSQRDAAAFCAWKGKRLPTEEEWEKAARGESGFTYPWGEIRPIGETANFLTEAAEPIGNRPDDCSPYNVYDLGGNVSELTASAVEGKRGPRPVVRGGCYKASATEMVTFYRRTNRGPDYRSEHVGFRCACNEN